MKKLGITLLERNVRAAGGEIDLVGLDGRTIVIVEVKSRSSDSFGTPQEAADLRKQRSVIRAARAFLKGKGMLDRPRRYDLAAVELNHKGRAGSVTWTRNAFDESSR